MRPPKTAGKSTVARRVTAALEGFHYLDTGAMYRAVTAYLLRFDNKTASDEEMADISEGLEMDGDRLVVCGEDVTEVIRTPEVTADVSRVSAVPLVRRVVQRKQRERKGRLVAEGRDIGSVVFPDAALKVYLDASLEERARRRQEEFGHASPEEIRARIARRDELDSTREDSPLIQAKGAIAIDTTNLTIEEVVNKIVTLVKERMQSKGDDADLSA